MSFRNPPVPWSQIERRLSDDPLGRGPWIEPVPGDGGDSPAWSRKRAALRGPGRSSPVPTPGWSPTPSCTATPTSASSTAPPIPRSWPRRRPGSDSRPWPSPTTTAATGWCASPRRPGPTGLPHRVRRRAHPGSHRACRWGRPTRGPARRAPPAGAGPRPPGLRPAGPGHQPGPAAGREGRAPHLAAPSWPTWSGRRRPPPTATGRCSPAVARGRCRPRWWPTARPRPARELARLVEAFGRDQVAVELWDHGDPLDSARNDALAELAVRAGVEVVATNNVHYATPARRPPGHRPGRGAGPAQPRRAGRLAAGRRPGPTCARGPSRPAASPATRAWSTGPPRWAGVRLRPVPGGPEPAALSRARRATTRCRWLRAADRARAPPAATAPPGRAGGLEQYPGPGPRSTTSWTSSSSSASPATS